MRLCEEEHLVWGKINLKWIFYLCHPTGDKLPFLGKHCFSGNSHLLVVYPLWIKSTNSCSSKCFKQWCRSKLCPVCALQEVVDGAWVCQDQGLFMLWNCRAHSSKTSLEHQGREQRVGSRGRRVWPCVGGSRWQQGAGAGTGTNQAAWHPEVQDKLLLSVHSVPRTHQICHACAGHLWGKWDGNRRAPAEHSSHREAAPSWAGWERLCPSLLPAFNGLFCGHKSVVHSCGRGWMFHCAHKTHLFWKVGNWTCQQLI